jgi:hypothetical protein
VVYATASLSLFSDEIEDHIYSGRLGLTLVSDCLLMKIRLKFLADAQSIFFHRDKQEIASVQLHRIAKPRRNSECAVLIQFHAE